MSIAVAVLGMHRSGTSCLTGLLEDAGVHLGDVSKKNPFNRKGNQERLSIMQLHDDVLASNGGAWNDPPIPPLAWNDKQVARLRELIEEYEQHSLWGFKDPRSLFTIEKWREFVPHLQFIGTLRNPLAVAQSLHKRSKMPLEDGVEVWRKYNEHLLDVWTNEKFPLVNFNLPANRYLEHVREAFDQIGLDTENVTLEFFDETLRTSAPVEDFILPSNVVQLYEHLLEITRERA